MTDLDLFRAFLEHAGIKARETRLTHGTGHGTMFDLDSDSDERWNGDFHLGFWAMFDRNDKLVGFGAFNAAEDS